MREKERRLVISFATTTQAMAMESKCLKSGQPGRLIPVPVQISAGCGFAWCAETGQRQALEEFIQTEGISVQQIYELVI